MGILTDESLEFAKEHIQKYYASDFFPKAFEFEALWYNWADVKNELMSKNVSRHTVYSPKTLASFKPKGTFRVVHQLEPIDAIIYTALAFQVADKVEAARIPIDEHVACSYRIELKDGSFFGSGNGFTFFTSKSEELANQYTYVLVTDITDFYNQIYLHRLNNAIEYADPNLKVVADDIESVLSRINSKASQGVPVGPAASIVMSEAILIDVDKFLIGKDVRHTRYVDDFRIFSDSEEHLWAVLEELTLYLYKTHRLTLATEKTKITESSKYVEEILHNHYELEKVEIFQTLEVFNPYTEENEKVEEAFDDKGEKAEAQLEVIAGKVLERSVLDLGLARSLVRKAKAYKSVTLVDVLFGNFTFFAPIINDVCLYLNAITDDVFAESIKDKIIGVLGLPIARSGLVKEWIGWYISQHVVFLANDDIKRYVMNGESVAHQATAAIATNDLAWIRGKRDDLYSVGNWERRALLHAAQILPSDEKTHWLRLTINGAPSSIDRWVAKWVLEEL